MHWSIKYISLPCAFFFVTAAVFCLITKSCPNWAFLVMLVTIVPAMPAIMMAIEDF